MEMESPQHIPPEEGKWNDIQKDWEVAYKAMEDNERTDEIIKITQGFDLEEGSRKIEEYLRENFNDLSQAQKNFLLLSLRVKNKKKSF